MIMNNEKKNLDCLIREESALKCGKYNLRQYANNPQKIHHDMCRKLVELADNNNMPMGVLVYIAVGTSAHKSDVFAKGYKKINVPKAEGIINLCKIFGNRFGVQHTFNDKVVHACAKFYEVASGVPNYPQVWQNIIDKTPIDGIQMNKVKRATDLLKKLCGDSATYSSVGRVKSIIL
jgi:hypothetical protein